MPSRATSFARPVSVASPLHVAAAVSVDLIEDPREEVTHLRSRDEDGIAGGRALGAHELGAKQITSIDVDPESQRALRRVTHQTIRKEHRK